MKPPIAEPGDAEPGDAQPGDAEPGADATVRERLPLRALDTLVDTTSRPVLATYRVHLPGYALGPQIGRGGMGEVVLAHDQEIGRDVAIKRLLRAAPSADAIARFLREARIQARLEHPAIVPVHEVGRDSTGQPYFTMKRLVGVTLAQLLVAAPPPPRQRLLRAFADVCIAVAFAHARGVIHRDLKPANIMLGDFGEIYVLDWGLARVQGDPESGGGGIADGIESLDGSTTATQAGALLGTPGYMAPEQIKSAATVATPADVYALGAILFEVLAGEPLHPPETALQSTLQDGAPASAAARKPDRGIPPELDALCAAALAPEPEARPTAGALAAQIERYLDGDRDVAHRRELARDWLARAHAELAADPIGQRAAAMRHAGRALALDPESGAAAELVTRLMLEPTSALPPELRDELDASDGRVQRRQSRIALGSFAAIAVILVFAAWNGMRSWFDLSVIAGTSIVMAIAAFALSRRRASVGEMLLVAIGNACLAGLVSRLFGSLIVAPATTCVMAVSLTSYPQLIDRGKLVIGILLASWCVPVILERAGIVQETWALEGEKLVSGSAMFELGGNATTALVIVTSLMPIVVIGLFANALARSRREAQRQLEIQAWHLRQLLPAVGAAAPVRPG